MSKFLSHRGYWHDLAERNSTVAFERSFALGFGTETDVRDLGGDLVISHDPPVGGEVLLRDLLALYAKARPGMLALNVKADGLQAPIAAALKAADVNDYFVFDMSVPDMLAYAHAGLRFFTRMSEYEPDPALYEQADGVWLDCFHSEWFREEHVIEHLRQGKAVCIVSPELHGRPHGAAWQEWFSWDIFDNPKVMMCTDLPEKAQAEMTA